MNAPTKSLHVATTKIAPDEGRKGSLPKVTLKAGHVRPVWTGHPWVFAQAIDRIEGGAVAGDEVVVVDPRGTVLGHGLYTPRSAIPVRMFTHDDTPIDGALIRRRLERAIQNRRDLGFPSHASGHETNAYRLVHAEGDGLPGLVVDVLGDVLVVQIGTIGIKRREGLVFDVLTEGLAPRAIVDRTSAQLAKLEGFEPGVGVVRGDTSIDKLTFVERGLKYEIPFALGQKTGFYLDQRTLRTRIEQLSQGKRVLDAFCFVGTFAMAAARGGASEVVAVDESPIAIEVGAECAMKNGLSGRIKFERSDARKALARASSEGGYDLVICDPPKLSPTKGSKDGALSAYRALAAQGCKATRTGGIFVMCSCSSAISMDDLTRALAIGAREARMHAVVFDRHFQGADHPVSAAFPEGLYLKSVIARLEAL